MSSALFRSLPLRLPCLSGQALARSYPSRLSIATPSVPRFFSTTHVASTKPFLAHPSRLSLKSPIITYLRFQTARSFGSLLFSVPKGFKNFQKGDAKKSDANESTPQSDKGENAKKETDQTPKDKEKEDKEDKDSDWDFRSLFGSGPDKKEDKESSSGGGGWLPGGIFALICAGVITWQVFSAMGPVGIGASNELSFQEFKQRLLAKGLVEKLVVQDKIAKVHLRPGASHEYPAQNVYFQIGSVESFERSIEAAQRDLGIDPMDFIPIVYHTAGKGAAEMFSLVVNMLFLGLILSMAAATFRMGKGGMGGGMGGGRNIFGIGKSNAQMITKETKIKTSFKDVAGLDEAKVEIMEFVKFLQAPQKFTRLGAKLPKGALLVGPPGTGKTLIARATAGEAKVPFFSISGSDFLEMFVGVGPARVRDLFKQAREHAPCIVFIDEIDAVGRARGRGRFSGGNDERENTLNQLLVEMDGFKSDTGVIVLAGTNRADILDPALLRPGRFDRQITIDKPDIRGRRQIFEVHLKNLKLANPVAEIAQRLSALTPGFAGADIANVCNEAALIAARSNKDQVELVDFEAAVDRVIGGLEKKNKVMTAEEKQIVAYHEAGHAVSGWFFEFADPLLKVTIVPRGSGALGYAQYLPQELNLYRRAQIVDKMCMALGGRVAEQLFFQQISTGAADDLKKVTRMAYSYVSVYGMSERLGHVSFQQSDENEFVKPYSEKTAQIIDEEASALIAQAYDRTMKLLEEKRSFVENLAKRLLTDETINHDVIVDVLGPRPFKSQHYDQYVKEAGKVDWDTNQAFDKKPTPAPEAGAGAGDKPASSDSQPQPQVSL